MAGLGSSGVGNAAVNIGSGGGGGRGGVNAGGNGFDGRVYVRFRV